MAFPCPLCGSSSYVRTSRMENDERTIRKTYYQCRNLECGVGFHTHEAFSGLTRKRVNHTGNNTLYGYLDAPA